MGHGDIAGWERDWKALGLRRLRSPSQERLIKHGRSLAHPEKPKRGIADSRSIPQLAHLGVEQTPRATNAALSCSTQQGSQESALGIGRIGKPEARGEFIPLHRRSRL